MSGEFINPEQSTELLGHSNTFYDLARKLSLYYEDPRFFEQAAISFTGLERTIGEHRQFPMVQKDRVGHNFEFNLPAYRFFRNDCGGLFGEVGGEVFKDLGETTRKLYIGCGLAQVAVQKDILEHPYNQKQLKQIDDLFADRSDIAKLLWELCPPKAEEVEPVWAQTEHLMGAGVYRINAIRASATYLFEAMSAFDEGEFAITAVTESRKALSNFLNRNRWQYLELSVIGFYQSHETGNKVFINGIPEWLIAFALPMNTNRLRNV